MKNVDQIIQYLSNEMTPEEAGSFEEALASSPVLKAEFEQVSKAFHLVREELQRRDEEAFRDKLLEVMESSEPQRTGKRISFRSTGYYLLPMAGAIAILLALFFMRGSPDEAVSRFLDPAGDPVLLASGQATRGEAASGILQYNQGAYREAMEQMQRVLDEDPGNQLAMVYRLLASMELDLQERVLEDVLATPSDTNHPLGQSLTWYTALALAKSDRRDEAVEKLERLTGAPGPYRKDAMKLKKILLK